MKKNYFMAIGMMISISSFAQTVDGGSPWEVAGIPYVNDQQRQWVKDLLIHNDRLIACGDFQLYYSDDGITWKESEGLPFIANPGFTGYNKKATEYITAKHDTLILSTDLEKYYYSTDNAENWTEFENSKFEYEVAQLFTSSDNRMTFRVFADVNKRMPYIQYTYDGATWHDCIRDDGSGQADVNGNPGFRRMTEYKGVFYAVGSFASPGQIPSGFNFSGIPQLYKSTDGITWNYVSVSGIPSNGADTWKSIEVFNNELYISRYNNNQGNQTLYKSSNGIDFTVAADKLGLMGLFNAHPYLISSISNGYDVYGPVISLDGSSWTKYVSARFTPFYCFKSIFNG